MIYFEISSILAMTAIISVLMVMSLYTMKTVQGQYYPYTTITIVKDAQIPSNEQFYEPVDLVVKPGTPVLWKNDDSVIHTATSGNALTSDSKFDTGVIPIGQSSQPIMMPSERGQYPYYCTLHPWMTGIITVL